jgi:hypothetical protein
MTRIAGRGLVVAITAGFGTGLPRGTAQAHEAQERAAKTCLVVCAPALAIEPTLTVENLLRRPRVLDLQDQAVNREDRSTEFEIIIAADVPTTLPRVALTFEAIWTPFASASENPFTGQTAEGIGRDDIADNAVELEFELNLQLVEAEETGGWVGTHFDIVDKFSPAERPRDAGAYTHKLNFELDTALALFNWLPKGNWLQNVEVEGSLDYVATGLPRAGDVVSRGRERFLDDASPWSFSAVLIVPVAPLRP